MLLVSVSAARGITNTAITLQPHAARSAHATTNSSFSRISPLLRHISYTYLYGRAFETEAFAFVAHAA